MTQDEIIRMAREAGALVFQSNFFNSSFDFNSEQLERFSALVAEPWIETNKELAKEIIELKKQAEQEPVTISCECGDIYERNSFGGRFIKLHGICPNCDAALQAAPVRTKDLTDEEMLEAMITYYGGGLSTVSSRDLKVARAVIAADREKNK